MHTQDEPVYLISVVAKALKIHPQTLRQYEREGLVRPSRTDGKMRLYSQSDMERIKSILMLTREMGVNLAGVDIILRLKDQIEEKDILINEITIKLETFSTSSASIPSAKIEQKTTGTSLVKKRTDYEIVVLAKSNNAQNEEIGKTKIKTQTQIKTE